MVFLRLKKCLWFLCIIVINFIVSSYSLTISPVNRFAFKSWGGGFPGIGNGYHGMSGGGYYPGSFYPQAGFGNIGGCPICDSSVYSYCSHKLIHDSCCCGDGYYTGNSFECEYMDCSYIHANSCREADLIANCCCNDPYRSMKPLLSNYFKK